ncbi:MAG: hypothetical protein U5K28_00890 [Halobacteriales archaeon]|nr:hypothetical protein [Halobacteriales archaeon]
MNRALPVAGVVGMAVGVASHQWLVGSWYVAISLAAIYVGAAYFPLAFDIQLLGEAFRFEERLDRLGYAVGLFGVCVSPIAFGLQYAPGTDTVRLSFVVWTVGLVAFFQFAGLARESDIDTELR